MGFEIPEGESLAGLVLVASRDLLDPNFHQTLVYIAEHGPEGTLGLVMNRPLDKKLGEVALSNRGRPAGTYRTAETGVGAGIRRSCGLERGTTRAGIERRLVAGVPAAHGDAGGIGPECHVGGVCRQGPAVEKTAAVSAE